MIILLVKRFAVERTWCAMSYSQQAQSSQAPATYTAACSNSVARGPRAACHPLRRFPFGPTQFSNCTKNDVRPQMSQFKQISTLQMHLKRIRMSVALCISTDEICFNEVHICVAYLCDVLPQLSPLLQGALSRLWVRCAFITLIRIQFKKIPTRRVKHLGLL
jgi:hypothetical protein